VLMLAAMPAARREHTAARGQARYGL